MSSKYIQTDRAHEAPHAWERAKPFVLAVFGLVFVMTGLTSGYATFNGFTVLLEPTGVSSTLTYGLAVIITLTTSSIIIVSWNPVIKYGTLAQGKSQRFQMSILVIALLLISIFLSTLSNLVSLAGPPSILQDWRETRQEQSAIVDQLEINAFGVTQLLPGWRAEEAKACEAAQLEIGGGTISGAGAGAGPVSFALSGACQQTRAFVEAMEEALAESEAAVAEARAAIRAMRDATRNRTISVVEREDQFLLAGDALIEAMQRLRVADLSQVLDAGAQQVQASIAELSPDSTYSAAQIETVRSIRAGIEGLIVGTNIITERLQANSLPDRAVIRSPDYVEAVLMHAWRYAPMTAAALGIDLFAMWAYYFLIVLGRGQSAQTPPAARSNPGSNDRDISTTEKG